MIAVLVEFEIEIAVGIRHPDASGVGVFLHRAGLGIQTLDRVLAEIAEPDVAVVAHHRVVRLHGFARQVIGGDDHARSRALRTGERLVFEFVLRRRRQIDLPDIVGETLEMAKCAVRIALHEALLDQRRHRLARHVGHARDEVFHDLLRGVVRHHRQREHVAGRAVDEIALLFRRAGRAQEPFGVRQLRGDIGRLFELHVRLRAVAVTSTARGPSMM